MLQQEARKCNKKSLFIYKQWNVIVGSTFRSLGYGPDNGTREGRGLSHYETLESPLLQRQSIHLLIQHGYFMTEV